MDKRRGKNSFGMQGQRSLRGKIRQRKGMLESSNGSNKLLDYGVFTYLFPRAVE